MDNQTEDRLFQDNNIPPASHKGLLNLSLSSQQPQDPDTITLHHQPLNTKLGHMVWKTCIKKLFLIIVVV